MLISDFDYKLPTESIAKYPPQKRGAARLLVIDRKTKKFTDTMYTDLAMYLKKNDLVIINDTKVIRARLIATNNENKQRELLLLEKHGQSSTSPYNRVMYRGKLRAGEALHIGAATITIEKLYTDGTAAITSNENILELAEQYGSVPLPPYLHRDATTSDIERYQTVFARNPGSVAAPTASLNLTNSLLKQLELQGVMVHSITLHVGLGTFMPIREDDVTKHHMHTEYCEIPRSTIAAIRKAREHNGRVVAIGTTVSRALEYFADKVLAPTPPTDFHAETDIFIYPGYTFKLVNAMLTNFHAPRSTVLMMAAAFAGTELLQRAYIYALNKQYAFLSYGDSMLIL